MAEFRLYCVRRGGSSRVLRVMLEKTLERGDRAIVRLSSLRREEELDLFLWLDPAASFLPHGRIGGFRGSGEDFTAEQPILLTTAETANSEVVDNGASVLFHWQEGGEKKGGMDIGVDGDRFGLCCFLYEDGDADAGVIAEDLWGGLCGGGSGGEMGFWYQEMGGGWRKRDGEQEKGKEKMIVKKEQVREEEQEQVQEAKREDIVVGGVTEPSQDSLL